MKSKRFIGLIPLRLKSKRIFHKPLLNLIGLPLFVHVYRRAKLSLLLDDVIVCCDDSRIYNIAKRFNVKCIITKKTHKNGTERISEAYKKIKKNYDLIVDIQGDEPLLNPKHIDDVIKFHLRNMSSDIILPSLKIKKMSKTSIVKVIKNKNDEILYLSRKDVPYNFGKKKYHLYKHLSIISFKPNALKKYSNLKKSLLEKIEDIELLRAIENDMLLGTTFVNSASISVDIKADYLAAIELMKKDKIRKKY